MATFIGRYARAGSHVFESRFVPGTVVSVQGTQKGLIMGQTQKMIDWCLATAKELNDEPRLMGQICLGNATTRRIIAGLREAAASFTPEEE